MIIGRGLLASRFGDDFADDANVVVYASGVSNSSETRPSEFQRERETASEYLHNQETRTFVYFSSCAVGTCESARMTPYLLHKAKMEALVLQHPGGLVLRLPQVVGKSANPHTLTNFIHRHVLSGEAFTIWRDAERNLVDIDDVYLIGRHIIRRRERYPRVVNIAHPLSRPIIDIVHAFERVLGKASNHSIAEGGSSFTIDTAIAVEVAGEIGVGFTDDYYERVIRKYYA